MNLFIPLLKLKGYPISESTKTLGKIRSLTKNDLIEWQSSKKWEIFEYHAKNNPTFSATIKLKTPTKWEDLPIQTKQNFQKPFRSLISDTLANQDLYISSTSGSSGHPFFFAKDKFCHALTWVQIQQLYAEHNISFSSRQARFYGIPLSGSGYWKEKFKDLISNRVRFPIFDLSDTVLEGWIKRFKNTRFEYVYGYTSSLVFFARYLIKTGRILNEICNEVKCCFVTSEVCTSEDKRILELGFGIPIFKEYGASEVGIIAFEDTSSQWKICNELLYIETVDNNGHSVPEGMPGNILVTSLFNKAMPFIRYQIGDTGVLSTNEYGEQVLYSLEGRTNDFVRLPSGRTSPGLTFYYISRRLLENAGFINEFIIKQKSLDTFEFVIDANRPLNDSDKSIIKKEMEEYLEPGLTLIVTEVDKIQRIGSGKIKHFYSEF